MSSSSSGGLFLSWTPPAGLWESYGLFLFDGSQQLVNTTLDREVVNYSFPGTRLTPGRLYRAVLRVESGGLMAASSCDGATGRITAEINHHKIYKLQKHVKQQNTNVFINNSLCSSGAGVGPPHSTRGRDIAQRHVEPRPLWVT